MMPSNGNRRSVDRRDHSAVPPRKREVLFVQSPRPNESLKILVYSPSIWGCYSHFRNRKTVPCFENTELCPGGHSELNRRWKGWLHGWSYDRNEPVFVQLTVEAANQLQEQVPATVNYRGITILVSRTAKGNGRENCIWESQYTIKPDHLMPQPLDPRRSIFNLWKFDYTDEPLARHLNGDPPPLRLNPDPASAFKALNGCLKTQDHPGVS